MTTGKEMTKKIAKKKLKDVVELDEPKTSTGSGLFDDLDDDLFSNPLDVGYDKDDGYRKTSLKTYPWQRSQPTRKTRISPREILEEKDGGVPTHWKFASEYEANKSISRDEKCDEVIKNGLAKAMRFAGADAEFHAVTTEELTEIIRDAFMDGAHFRKENP